MILPHWRMLTGIVMILLMGGAFAACTIPYKATLPAVPTAVNNSASTISAIATPAAPVSPPVTVVVCDDTSAAYPRHLFDNTKSAIADWAEETVTPGSPGAILYVNSFVPSGNLMVINIPSVPPEPSPPNLEPTPGPADTSNSNPFDAGAKQRAANARQAALDLVARTNAEAERAYEQALANFHAQYAQILARTRQQTSTLRTMEPPVSSRQTNLSECLTLASTRLVTAPGPKILILSTGLDNTDVNIDNTRTTRLNNVGVYILNIVCRDAQDCVQKKAAWTADLSSCGVSFVQFYDPAEKATLANPFKQP